MRLSGKTIIVTGGAHGIGRAYCERLARDGASVVCLDIDGEVAARVADGICANGGSAMPITADVRELPQLEQAAATTAERFGGVNGLVNNAGMLNVVPISRVTFEHIPDQEWDESFRLNTKSVWYACKAVVPYLRQAGGGSIVNIASSTVYKGLATRSHYVAAKSALIGFTRSLSRELGGDWIRVNAVCPGSTLSEENPTPEVVKMREAPVKDRSLKRVQRPEDLVGTISFLMSDDSEFITGQTIIVEGGGVFI